MKIFLGGTCNGSTWRNRLIPLLTKNGLDYFNPVVEDWDASCIAREEEEKIKADYLLFVITPKMKGVYSIAEAVDAVNNNQKVIFGVLSEDNGVFFDKKELKSLKATSEIIERRGGYVVFTWNGLINLLKQINNV